MCKKKKKKNPVPQYNSFMIKSSFDVARIMSYCHLRLCPKGGKLENTALTLILLTWRIW